MPPTVTTTTLDDIKAYQQRVEKNENTNRVQKSF